MIFRYIQRKLYSTYTRNTTPCYELLERRAHGQDRVTYLYVTRVCVCVRRARKILYMYAV